MKRHRFGRHAVAAAVFAAATALGGNALANYTFFKWLTPRGKGGAFEVGVQKVEFYKGKGGDYWLAVCAYDDKTGGFIGCNEGLTVPQVGYDPAALTKPLSMTLRVDKGPLAAKSGNVLFTIESYFKPAGGSWYFTNYVPLGRGAVSGGKLTSFGPTIAAMMTGRRAEWFDSGFGAAASDKYWFHFDSTNNCMRWGRSWAQSGYGMGLAETSLGGCATFANGVMALWVREMTTTDASGTKTKTFDNAQYWQGYFKIYDTGLSLFNPRPGGELYSAANKWKTMSWYLLQ